MQIQILYYVELTILQKGVKAKKVSQLTFCYLALYVFGTTVNCSFWENLCYVESAQLHIENVVYSTSQIYYQNLNKNLGI